MSADSSDASRRSRLVLRDITNQPGKRGFSLISHGQSKHGDRNDEQVSNENDGRPVKRVPFGVENIPAGRPNAIDKENFYSSTKQVPVGIEKDKLIQKHGNVDKEYDVSLVRLDNQLLPRPNLVEKEKGPFAKQALCCSSVDPVPSGTENLLAETPPVAKCDKGVAEVLLCPLKGGKAYRLQSHGNSECSSGDVMIGILKTTVEAKKHSLVEKGTSICRQNVSENAVERGSAACGRENSKTSLPQVESSQLSKDVRSEASGKCQGDEGRDLFEVARNGSTKEASQVSEDGKSSGGSYLAYSISASVVGPRLTEFQPNKSFELARCTVLKDDGCSSSNAGLGFLKDCMCSLCMKAACIWSDLHCRDVEGRLSVSMESRREACDLVKKIREKEIGSHGQGNSRKCTKLEADLLTQWKSLFLSMEDIFVKECNQLESSFVALKEMRENCKMNLEMTHGVPIDLPPFSSDTSTDYTGTT